MFKFIRLTSAETVFLKVFKGTKPAYRRNAFEYEANRPGLTITETYESLQLALINKGLLKANKRGHVSMVLTFDQACRLIALQTATIESLETDIIEALERVNAARDAFLAVAHMLTWPDSERRTNASQYLVSAQNYVGELRFRLQLMKVGA